MSKYPLKKDLSQIILFQNLFEEPIITKLLKLEKSLQKGNNREKDSTLLHDWVNEVLTLSTRFNFNHNLWQCALIYFYMVSENPFSLSCERKGLEDRSASIYSLVKNDFLTLQKLLHYDFSYLDQALDSEVASSLTHYQARDKSPHLYQKEVGDAVETLRSICINTSSVEEMMDAFIRYYQEKGCGILGLYRAFSFHHNQFSPVHNLRKQTLKDLVGYEQQKEMLMKNTLALVQEKPANNVLLYGDSGTGKSSSVKALIYEYWDQGLRIIEVKKTQLAELEGILSQLKIRPYPFIIFMDDLSFEEFEVEYKYLKAIIEGGLALPPQNVVIYATSNRRHFIKEVWDDRKDMSAYEVHRSDSMQEKLSLVDRFGVTINYTKPSQNEFFEIVRHLAKSEPRLHLEEEELLRLARQWELQYHGFSGRSARQFIDYLVGQA